MKTKLFLFMALLIGAEGFSQINVSESFETSIPSGWTMFGDGFTREFASLSCNGSYTLTAQNNTNSAFWSYIQTPNYVSSGQPIAVSFDYKTTYGDSYGTAFIFYELNNSGNRVNVGQYALDITCNTLSATIPSSAIPSGTTIKFSFQLNRSGGFEPLQMDNVIISQLLAAPTPIVSNVSVTAITSASASVNYSLNANNTVTTSVIKYGVTSGALTLQVTGFPATGTTTTHGTASIAGLNPNTEYFYRIEAENGAGMATSLEGNFTTLALDGSIAEYNFNGTLSNINGTSPFDNSFSNVFTAGRNANSGQAIYMNEGTMQATITNLPTGNEPRTVSIWIKPIVLDFDNIVFKYGLNQTNMAYGFSFRETTINNYGYGNDLTGSFTLPLGQWKHVVCTYDATGQAIVYIDGAQILTGTKPAWNTSAADFFLGKFDGEIDDLKIYNFALTSSQVTNLFNNNTLSSPNFNQNNLEVSLYPNPANAVLNIETALEIQSVEIYNIQGQKVRTANQKQINISDLAAGMYMIRIQDNENGIATKKFVKQ